MEITYHKTAYIQCTTPQMDMILHAINNWADGCENVCTTIEEVISALGESDTPAETKAFLQEVVDTIESNGDIVFHK